MELVKVVFDIPLNKSFTYLAGKFEGKLIPGARVLVPFGKNKKLGWVLAVEKDYKLEKYKEIKKIYDDQPLLTEELLQIAEYLSKNYFSSIGQSLATINKNLLLKKKINQIDIPKFPKNIIDEKEDEFYNFIKQEKFQTIFILFGKDFYKEKTYIGLSKYLKEGSILFLFPEIITAEEFYKKLYQLFGEEVILFHSQLPREKKTFLWQRMLKEKNLLIVGTRIAVFSPVSDLKTIVVDEGENFSYIEQQKPKYNTVLLAKWRAERKKIPLFIGENCLSVGEYLTVKEKKAIFIKVPTDEVKLPEIIIIPMKKANLDKNMPFFSKDTISFLEESILKNEKILILHNRKGSSKIFVCEKCDYKFLCPKCDNRMVPYEENKTIICRICKEQLPFPQKCPKCGSKKIKMKGWGIERIKKVIEQNYPELKILKKTAQEKNIQIEKDFDIILGTKTIDTILPFLDVKLIIFVNGDLFFNFPDYHAEERFFIFVNNTLKKIKCEKSKVIIQTFNPNLHIYQSLKEKNFESFYENELKIRKQLNYPPFVNILKIEIEGKKKGALESKSEIIDKFIMENGLSEFFAQFIYFFKSKKHTCKYIFKFDEEEKQKLYPIFQKLNEQIDASIEINPENI